MNERIKELEKQSIFYNEEEETWEFDREKFAELIVKEYGNIVLHYANVDEGVAVANKHFGVK